MATVHNIHQFGHAITAQADATDGGKPITYVCDPRERDLAMQIATRACVEARQRQGIELDGWLVFMDILTWHCNVERLRLLALLLADPGEFSHDVVGIGCHIDRRNGRRMGDFKPVFVEIKQ